jgi:uroporphyrinogen decarboxylase
MMIETMTSRERVLAAVEHRPADRYPIDFGMHFSTGISVFAYQALRRHLGLDDSNVEAIDAVQMLARVDDDVRELFHVDTVLLRPGFADRERWNPWGGFEFWYPVHQRLDRPNRLTRTQTADGGWDITDEEGRRMRMPAGGYTTAGDWLNWGCEPDDGAYLEATMREAERLYKETDAFTCFMGFPAFFGDLDFCCDMLTDPESVIARNDQLLVEHLDLAGRLLAGAGEYIGCIEINSDLGTQQGPMVRPSLYEELVAPYVKKLCAFIHDNSDCKTFLHSCGSVEPFLDCLIDAGIDIFNPVQITAANMDPAMLKERYGDRICFWGGGCNTQQVLSTASPDEVRANVRELTGIFKPGGGFVFNQVHNVMGDAPPENVVAMLEEAYANSWHTPEAWAADA